MIALTELTHHATLFTHPERKEQTEKLWNELTSLSHAHILYNQNVLDIDTARNLISWANTPYHEHKIALISFHTITLQAQNALLKIFEEPRKGIQFILITGNKQNIIPTLLSRLEFRKQESSDDVSSANSLAKLFLKTSHSERMKLKEITELLTRTDNEDRKDRESVQLFIYSLGQALTESKGEGKHLLETATMAQYAADPSASGKAILEYLALLLPQTR